MKTLLAVLCTTVFCLFVLPGTGMAIPAKKHVAFLHSSDIPHLVGPIYSWMSPVLLPNGEYIGRTEKSLIVFKKHGTVITGSLYSAAMPNTYCVWGVIAPNGEFIGGEIILPKIYTTDKEDMKGNDKEEEGVSVALENFEIMPWGQFKRSHETPYGDMIESMSAVFKDCKHFFAVLDGGS